ncbi:MAG TPA: efflux RND transporter permease subunit, partial [Vicinamibacterales bacterium]|nr:efflux RND transporter permease subunit [Vicinamibacterales bacterium]
TMTLTVTFDVETDPNVDQVNVQNRMAQAQPNLPTAVSQYGLTMRKSTGLPMLIIGLSSPKHTYNAVFQSNYANINIIDALYRVPGVGEVRVFGAGDYAMRIWLRPDDLSRLGLTVPDVARAVQQQSTVNPSGQIGADPVPSGQEMTYTVRAQGRLETAEEFGHIVVRANPDGSLVRLSDVARVELGAVNYQLIGRMNGQPGCAIGVFQAPGSNALEVAEGVKRVMTDISSRFPDDLHYAYTLDTTLAVSEGIREIVWTLGEAMVLVIIVVYLFLQSWRATIIPMVAVPVSLIGTFAVFPLLGFSVNTLSLFGLVLAIGLVVDDAIVVVEAVEHHIEHGMSPRDATIRAMDEVSGPVVSIALILACVFVPVGLMHGIQGRLNEQFAITIAVSVLISAFNALTLSPALAAILLRPRTHQRWSARFFGAFNRAFDRTATGYVRASRLVIRKAWIGVAAIALFMVAAGLIGRRLPTSFVPEEDYGYFLLNVTLPPAASLERTDAICRQVDRILAATPGIEGYNTIVGFSLLTRVTSSNNGFYFVGLRPWSERTPAGLDARTIVNGLNARFAAELSEGVALAVMPPSIPGLGAQGGFSMWLQDRSGGSIDFLNDNLQRFLAAARKRPELVNVTSPFSAAVPQVFLDVDRDKALKQGVQLPDIYQTLQAYLGGLFVNQFNRFGRQWRVFLQAEGADRDDPSRIGRFYVRNGAGAMVPLSSLATTKPTAGPQYTNRFNVYRAVQITGAAAPGYSSGQALDALESVAQNVLPREIGYDWSDLSYQEKRASGSAAPIFGLSLLFVFLVLAALYESWSLPFSVLLSVPIAVVGAFGGLALRHFDLDVYAQIGLVMLVGLAAKNAILIVEFAKARREHGRGLVDAALEGARVRLRPILMTSFAFICGCLPLCLARGAGAASRQILGTAVVFGMLLATVVAILFIPMLYVVVERLFARRAVEPTVAPTDPAESAS